MNLPDLPITDALPRLISVLGEIGCAVLQAPPGAGKTTVVPLALLKASLTGGRILMLEPRRLAARAAAERMAQILGQKTGETVGYRIRGESAVSGVTRIEVVTEGILTRMIQSDPSLTGIGAVIFDEFHERSINADLGLALVWEARSALRDDLLVLVMSATLDAEPVANMLSAPVITSQGRAFPVETRYLDRPIPKTQRFEQTVADLVLQAVRETDGGVLVFLPGEGEIRRVASLVAGKLPPECEVFRLFGAMAFADQRAAMAPAPGARKVVLATSIAETSLTIDGIGVVVDAGRARRSRFDPGSGMSGLVTERVSKAEADQRRGRAGRVSKGVCYRMWAAGQSGAMARFAPPEIETADLAPLVLELAVWGAADTGDLAFLTRPNPGAFASAQSLLKDLGALDASARITAHGRALARWPLHPRLGHIMMLGGPGAAGLAALLADRDPLPRAGADLMLRQKLLQDPHRFSAEQRHASDHNTTRRIRAEAKRLTRLARPGGARFNWPEMVAMAYPDRIGLRRAGDAPRWVLSCGKGAWLDGSDTMATARLIVATDLDGDTREARVRHAIELSEPELRNVLGDRFVWRETCVWSRRDQKVLARRQEFLGAVVLSDVVWKDAPADAIALAILDGVRDLGLRFSTGASLFAARVALARTEDPTLPELSEKALLDTLETWLLPHVGGRKTAEALRNLDLLEPMRACLTWEQMRSLDRIAPSHFTTALNRRVPIDYSASTPAVSVRLQEMFGVKTHPVVAGRPLRLTLLSPAHRPVQTTTDLPGFWASSYGDVRKDMRGRYPKHPWPEDPEKAAPTTRTKRRKP